VIAGAILAGGRARRMGGVPKALLEVGGRTILVRQIAALSTVVDEILLVVGDPAGFPSAAELGVKVVADRAPGMGPLAGLQAALHATRAESILAVGCDLPFLDARLLARVRDAAPGAEAVVPRVGGRPQALHARYARAVLPLVEARLARGALRLVELLDELRVVWLDEPELRSMDPELRGLTNVNTPEELAAARREER
jgi:molybdopterin-guanine dinucleotide biosynthesis protein A